MKRFKKMACNLAGILVLFAVVATLIIPVAAMALNSGQANVVDNLAMVTCNGPNVDAGSMIVDTELVAATGAEKYIAKTGANGADMTLMTAATNNWTAGHVFAETLAT